MVISGKRRRHHFQVANASDRLHCDNVPKPLSRRLFLIACAQSYRESRLARNVTALIYNYTLHTCNAFMCLFPLLQNSNTWVETERRHTDLLARLLNIHYVNTITMPVGLLTALPVWISYSLWISWISIIRQTGPGACASLELSSARSAEVEDPQQTAGKAGE